MNLTWANGNNSGDRSTSRESGVSLPPHRGQKTPKTPGTVEIEYKDFVP
jgi:hypothetical protein